MPPRPDTAWGPMDPRQRQVGGRELSPLDNTVRLSQGGAYNQPSTYRPPSSTAKTSDGPVGSGRQPPIGPRGAHLAHARKSSAIGGREVPQRRYAAAQVPTSPSILPVSAVTAVQTALREGSRRPNRLELEWEKKVEDLKETKMELARAKEELAKKEEELIKARERGRQDRRQAGKVTGRLQATLEKTTDESKKESRELNSKLEQAERNAKSLAIKLKGCQEKMVQYECRNPPASESAPKTKNAATMTDTPVEVPTPRTEMGSVGLPSSSRPAPTSATGGLFISSRKRVSSQEAQDAPSLKRPREGRSPFTSSAVIEPTRRAPPELPVVTSPSGGASDDSGPTASSVGRGKEAPSTKDSTKTGKPSADARRVSEYEHPTGGGERDRRKVDELEDGEINGAKERRVAAHTRAGHAIAESSVRRGERPRHDSSDDQVATAASVAPEPQREASPLFFPDSDDE